jgi:hypothetical protein
LPEGQRRDVYHHRCGGADFDRCYLLLVEITTVSDGRTPVSVERRVEEGVRERGSERAGCPSFPYPAASTSWVSWAGQETTAVSLGGGVSPAELIAVREATCRSSL